MPSFSNIKKVSGFNRLLLFLFSITPLIVTSYYLLLEHPMVWQDEFVTINTVENIKKLGHPALSIYGNTLYRLKDYALWYPPLYYYLIRFWVYFFPLSIESLRFLSFLLAILSLICIYLIGLKIFKKEIYPFISIILISSDIFFGQSTRVARQEILVVFLTSLSILLWLYKKPKKIYNYIVYGIISGIPVAVHPMGILCVIYISLYIIFNKLIKKLLYLFIFILSSLLPIGIWFLSILNHLDIFIAQMKPHMLKKEIVHVYLFELVKTSNLWRLYFFLLLLIPVIALIKKTNKSIYFKWIFYSYIVSLLTVLITKEQWYLVYLQPFVLFMIIILFKNKKTLSFIGLSVVLFIFFLNLINYKDILINSFKSTSYISYSKNIYSILKNNELKNKNIFINAIPDPSPYLYGRGIKLIYSSQPLPISQEDYNNLLKQMNYVIFNRYASGFINSNYLLDYISQRDIDIILYPSADNNYIYIIKL